MKIIRDGKEYELTFSEMIQAHEEYEFDCMVEDVKSQYDQSEYDVELSEDDINTVASFALHSLHKNDSYYESYWMTVQYTLDNYIDNVFVAKEDNE